MSNALGKNKVASRICSLCARLSKRIMPNLLVRDMPLNADMIWSLHSIFWFMALVLKLPRRNEKSNFRSGSSTSFWFFQPRNSNSSINLWNFSSIENILNDFLELSFNSFLNKLFYYVLVPSILESLIFENVKYLDFYPGVSIFLLINFWAFLILCAFLVI